MCNCKTSKTKYIYVVLLPFKYIEIWETSLCLLPYNLKSWARGANIPDCVHQQNIRLLDAVVVEGLRGIPVLD